MVWCGFAAADSGLLSTRGSDCTLDRVGFVWGFPLFGVDRESAELVRSPAGVSRRGGAGLVDFDAVDGEDEFFEGAGGVEGAEAAAEGDVGVACGAWGFLEAGVGRVAVAEFDDVDGDGREEDFGEGGGGAGGSVTEVDAEVLVAIREAAKDGHGVGACAVRSAENCGLRQEGGMARALAAGLIVGMAVWVGAAMGQGRRARTPAPVRDPHTAGYVEARELADGENAPADVDGNFILGPTHKAAAEMTPGEGVPRGTVDTFIMKSSESNFYPGIAREENTYPTPDPADPTKVMVSSHPQPYTRRVTVYIPKQYVAGTEAPFIVGADGPDMALFTALDRLIAEHRVPAMIAISIGNGGGDAQGSERGLEYDTMSGRYAEFVEQEVLPRVEKEFSVKLTHDPEGRAAMGGSSGGSCAFIMAWYHPELYHRVLTYSGTYVNQQWPANAETPHGAWEFHEHLIPESAAKPLRIWMEVGDRDNLTRRDGYHDWVLANENMARVLAAKGYHYQFVFARNAGHTDRAVKEQTLAEALEYVWKGYRGEGAVK